MQDTLFPQMPPSDQELAQLALAQPLEDKIKTAITLLRHYASKALLRDARGYYLAFSGGKDSQVIHRLAQMADIPFHAHYNVTTVDPPELLAFIRERYPSVIWDRPPLGQGFFALMRTHYGLPTRFNRWCCARLKEKGGEGQYKIVGVRIQESARRAKLWKNVRQDTRTDTWLLAPIAYWTERDVWDFLAQNDLPHCELYDQGFPRIGCVGCCMASPKQRAKQFARWPRFLQAYLKNARAFYDGPARPGRERRLAQGKNAYTTFESYWNHAMGEETANDPAQCTFTFD